MIYGGPEDFIPKSLKFGEKVEVICVLGKVH